MIAYGEEWEAEVTKMSKRDLIAMLRRVAMERDSLQAAQPALVESASPALRLFSDETCPFCGALNSVDTRTLMHPYHITSMGAACSASGMTVDEAKDAARFLPTMDDAQ